MRKKKKYDYLEFARQAVKEGCPYVSIGREDMIRFHQTDPDSMSGSFCYVTAKTSKYMRFIISCTLRGWWQKKWNHAINSRSITLARAKRLDDISRYLYDANHYANKRAK